MDCHEPCCLCSQTTWAKTDGLEALGYGELHFVDAEVAFWADEDEEVAVVGGYCVEQEGFASGAEFGLVIAMCNEAALMVRCVDKLLESGKFINSWYGGFVALFGCRDNYALDAFAFDCPPFGEAAVEKR